MQTFMTKSPSVWKTLFRFRFVNVNKELIASPIGWLFPIKTIFTLCSQTSITTELTHWQMSLIMIIMSYKLVFENLFRVNVNRRLCPKIAL